MNSPLLAALLATLLLCGCAARSTSPTPAQMRADIASMAAEYPHDLAAAKGAGLPLSMTALEQPLPPAGENAAPVYDDLMQALKVRPIAGQDAVLDALAKIYLPSPAQLALARPALARREDLLRLVHAATAKPTCVFDKDWTMPDPAEIKFPEFATMREAARLIEAQSEVPVSDGKPLEAAKNQALGFRIADQAAGEPTLIGYLVSVAIDAITLNGMQKIIYLSHGDPAVARAVRAAVERGWRPSNLDRALRTESAFQQGIVSYIRPGGYKALDSLTGESAGALDSGPSSFRPVGYRPGWSEFLDANDAFILTEMVQIVSAAEKPYPSAKADLSKIDKNLQDPTHLSHLLGVIVLPEISPTLDERAQLQAIAEVTEAGAAVLVLKGKYGRYPATLSQAMGKAPVDPFDGKPLRYRREGAGFAVYSVGPSGKFDGGSPTVRPPATDTVFRYPLPAYLAPAK